MNSRAKILVEIAVDGRGEDEDDLGTDQIPSQIRKEVLAGVMIGLDNSSGHNFGAVSQKTGAPYYGVMLIWSNPGDITNIRNAYIFVVPPGVTADSFGDPRFIFVNSSDELRYALRHYGVKKVWSETRGGWVPVASVGIDDSHYFKHV